MDEIARYNGERWKALAAANAVYTRPALDLNERSAQEKVDPEGRLGSLNNKDVLCLASGGGQQSPAFALLGARVTVFDLSEDQLERDRQAAEHYGLDIKTLQGDIRDLSAFGDDSFDIVFHGYSLGFVPDAGAVFSQVGRVIRDGGIYSFNCANPFFMGLTENDWNGKGYTVRHPYLDGERIDYVDQGWVYDNKDAQVPPPREYRHTLGTLIHWLVEHGFVVTHVSDEFEASTDAEPGSWEHLLTVAPPWLTFVSVYRPDVLLMAPES